MLSWLRGNWVPSKKHEEPAYCLASREVLSEPILLCSNFECLCTSLPLVECRLQQLEQQQEALPLQGNLRETRDGESARLMKGRASSKGEREVTKSASRSPVYLFTHEFIMNPVSPLLLPKKEKKDNTCTIHKQVSYNSERKTERALDVPNTVRSRREHAILLGPAAAREVGGL